MSAMDIAQATIDRIGQPESELLEYKAVLPPAATIAQLVCAFANTKGGAIVLGVAEDGKGIVINGLSDEFRAVQITRKAIDLLSPTPAVSYDYVVHEGKRLFVIEVQKSSAEVSLGGKVYVRAGERTTLKLTGPVKTITDPGIDRLSKALAEDRKSCTEARAKCPFGKPA
jgi:predicted HTH transcriptional regulator